MNRKGNGSLKLCDRDCDTDADCKGGFKCHQQHDMDHIPGCVGTSKEGMDYCTVEVGHVPGAELGDVATLIGRDGVEEIRTEEVANAAGTIPYEVTCSLGARVHRVFHGGEAGSSVRPREPVA